VTACPTLGGREGPVLGSELIRKRRVELGTHSTTVWVLGWQQVGRVLQDWCAPAAVCVDMWSCACSERQAVELHVWQLSAHMRILTAVAVTCTQAVTLYHSKMPADGLLAASGEASSTLFPCCVAPVNPAGTRVISCQTPTLLVLPSAG
jgi:hypothetical protein